MIADITVVPWYANPVLLPAASGLLGVIVGGLITAGANFLLDEMRATREEKKEARAARVLARRASRLIDKSFKSALDVVEMDLRDKTRSKFPHNPVDLESWNQNCGAVATEVSSDCWDTLSDAMVLMEHLRSFYDQEGVVEPLDPDFLKVLSNTRDAIVDARKVLEPIKQGG